MFEKWKLKRKNTKRKLSSAGGSPTKKKKKQSSAPGSPSKVKAKPTKTSAPGRWIEPLHAHKPRSSEDLAAKIQHLEQNSQKLLTDLETIKQKQEAEIIMLRR
eukprot:UN05475